MVVAALAIIVASIAFSAWRKYNFCVVTAIACTAVFAISLAPDIFQMLAFMPRDTTDPTMVYTILTSMYTHVNMVHLIFNMVGLAFIGIMLEQRIGTRPFILLYLLAGFFGTMAFAASDWNNPYSSVVGASGAVSGVLGGLARLYPNERVILFPLPVPIRMWTAVLLFVLLQFVFVTGGNVAWQAHLGGLVAGVLLAPLVVKVRSETIVRRTVPNDALRKLAVTPELQGILKRIELETVPDVRKAWTDHFMSKARCPICGSPIRVSGDAVRCSKGHLL